MSVIPISLGETPNPSFLRFAIAPYSSTELKNTQPPPRQERPCPVFFDQVEEHQALHALAFIASRLAALAMPYRLTAMPTPTSFLNIL